jgi:hypothetical protein
LGPLGRYIETQLENVGILSARIIDPTGTAIAVPGVTGVRNLRKMRVGIKGDRLRVRAIIPVNENAPAIDPTLAGGATVTVSDRDGTFYSVTIPELLWQDQSPIGSRWTYADPGGVVGGVQKATIKRLGKEGDLKGYKLDLQAAGRDLSGADFPSMTVAVAVARPEDLVFGFPSIHRAQGHCSGTIKGPKVDCK